MVILQLVVIFSASFSQSVQNVPKATLPDILVLFNSYGFLYKNVDKDFEFPDSWNVLQVSADRWYIERKVFQQEYINVKELPEGKYTISGNVAVFENGDKYVSTPFGLAKVINEGKTSNVLKVASKSDALFSVPGGYRIYYTLKGNTLEQFFELRSPVDKAYVILSSAPEEGLARVSYSKMSLSAESVAEEISGSGRKIFVLGYIEGLLNGLNIRNKVLPVTRKDFNKIELPYTYTYNWQPADYFIEIKTTDELPSGIVYVYSDVLGNIVPIGVANMPDLNKEGEIFVSKSWQVYHSWTITRMTKSAGKVLISGELNLKGVGLTRVVIRGKNISNLRVSHGKIWKEAKDYVEVEIPLSGPVKVSISFNYDE